MKNIFLILTTLTVHQNIQTMFRVLVKNLVTPVLALGATQIIHQRQLHCAITDSDRDIIEQYTKRTENIFAKIDANKAVEYLITEKKAEIILSFLKMQQDELRKSGQGSIQSEDSEAHFFKGVEPIKISEEELKRPFRDRFSENYIGELPSQISNVIDYFENYDHCIKENAEIHNRLLVHGKPGNGKTHLFKVLAQELQLPSLSFPASFFADKYIGMASKRIRRAFESANQIAQKTNKPVLIFIDEIDALASQRKDITHDENRKTLSALLVELQNNESNKNLFIIAATNDFAVLDEAIKDRFSGSVCEVKDLNDAQRAKLVLKIFRDRKLPQDDKLAGRLADVMAKDFSNRDLEYVIKTAKMMQVIDNKKNPQNNKHFCHYVRKVIDDSGKNARFAYFKPTYSDGI